MSELKPCPFCGKEQMTDEERGDSNNPYTGGTRLCDTHNCNAVSRNWNNRPIEDILRARIAELEAAAKWIPVEERLPKTCGCYLTLADDWVEQDYFNLEGKWLSGSNVTHWQPLPPPPEAQS